MPLPLTVSKRCATAGQSPRMRHCDSLFLRIFADDRGRDVVDAERAQPVLHAFGEPRFLRRRFDAAQRFERGGRFVDGRVGEGHRIRERRHAHRARGVGEETRDGDGAEVEVGEELRRGEHEVHGEVDVFRDELAEGARGALARQSQVSQAAAEARDSKAEALPPHSESAPWG